MFWLRFLVFRKNMKQLVMIHWWMCHPDNDIFCKALETRDYDPFEEKKRRKNWLKDELKLEYQTIKPDMPNKDMASYKARKIWFEKIFPYLNDEDLVLIFEDLSEILKNELWNLSQEQSNLLNDLINAELKKLRNKE